jgi:hypothetical protein
MLQVAKQQSKRMSTPLLHRQLHEQLSQFIHPQDKRHLEVLAENVASILLSESGCLSHWIKFLKHRDCKARSHMARLSYFVNNPRITAQTYYYPLIRQFLAAWEGMEAILTLDTSVFWNEYCLIEVCLVWGGRSVPLAQKVMEHPSATVAYSDYCELLETAQKLLPPDCQVTLLADRGFAHGELIRWLTRQSWHWAIRAKSDLKIIRANGLTCKVAELMAPQDQAYFFHNVTILDNIHCHFATAHLSVAGEPWAVLSDIPASLQLFQVYGQRFGGIEPHFKDYQSAGFDLPDSRLRGAQALTTLFLLLAMATLLCISAALQLLASGQRSSLDWHSQRGLSFFQLGLRELQSLCYLRRPIPPFLGLPRSKPPTASASRKKRRRVDSQIEFSKVTNFDL